MRLSSVLYILAFAAIAQAHFSLTYPPPWGKFDEDNQPKFCDGYRNASTRTVFPLTGGIINLLSTHANWTVGVLLSTVPNPTSFDNFTSSGSQPQLAVPYFRHSGDSQVCFRIDIGSSGIQGVKDGKNVTIQIVFDGGDGSLYQCADLTLSNLTTIPANETSNCKTISTNGTSSSTSGALDQHPQAFLPATIVLALSGLVVLAL